MAKERESIGPICCYMSNRGTHHALLRVQPYGVVSQLACIIVRVQDIYHDMFRTSKVACTELAPPVHRCFGGLASCEFLQI